MPVSGFVGTPAPEADAVTAQFPSEPSRDRLTSESMAASQCVLCDDVRAHMASKTSASTQGNVGPEVRHRSS